MIQELQIRQFKSIEELTLSCRRVNVFLGKPNVGKSNILEAIGLLGLPYAMQNIKELVRIESAVDLFHDQDTSKKIHIIADDVTLQIHFENGEFKFDARNPQDNQLAFQRAVTYTGDFNGGMSGGPLEIQKQVKYYKFAEHNIFPDHRSEFLLSPDGRNLAVVLQTHADLKKAIVEILADFDFRIVFKPQEGKLEVQKQVGDTVVSLPYSLLSDTLQRIIFYYAAMLTNKDSILIFEEPESHSFPFYTKFLAERIARDNSNQYFVSTHNPYLLSAFVEKTPKEDLAVFITYFDDYQTKAKQLSDPQLQDVLDLDASVFFNLDRYYR